MALPLLVSLPRRRLCLLKAVVDGEARVVERDRPALRVIRGEERVGSEAVVDRRQLPAQVVRVLHPRVRAERAGGWELVRGVAEDVDAPKREPLDDLGFR